MTREEKVGQIWEATADRLFEIANDPERAYGANLQAILRFLADNRVERLEEKYDIPELKLPFKTGTGS